MANRDGLRRLDAHAYISPAEVGGKAEGLLSLIRAGAHVPPTWVLPTGSMLTARDVEWLAGIEHSWAVRSSAVGEDGTTHSFAGLFETILDVPSAGVPQAVDRVLASAHSPRVRAYRRWSGSSHDIAMAVVLQPYWSPQASAIWVGRNVQAGRLEWSTGSGERLVGGEVTPQVEEWAHGDCRSQASPLSSAQGPVGEECLRMQRAFGTAIDLELAVIEDRLHWLQSRPVTAALPAPADTSPTHTTPTAIGTPASGGRVVGTPSLLEELDDTRWQPGDILLATTTGPQWVPLMAQASALVTAHGGMLCHAAIVARELGIPCVTGIGPGVLTALGAARRIEVDGDTGAVRAI